MLFELHATGRKVNGRKGICVFGSAGQCVRVCAASSPKRAETIRVKWHLAFRVTVLDDLVEGAAHV